MLAWHFTNGDRLRDGRTVPPKGETLKHKGPLTLCESGLHASVCLIDALKYTPGTTLHRVECGGEIIESSDKLVCGERTIVESANMLWALVEFAENCAKRAAAYYAAAAAADAADAAEAAAEAYYATADAADAAEARAAYYAAAAASSYYAAYAGGEREHQNSTLELWFECMKGQP